MHSNNPKLVEYKSELFFPENERNQYTTRYVRQTRDKLLCARSPPLKGDTPLKKSVKLSNHVRLLAGAILYMLRFGGALKGERVSALRHAVLTSCSCMLERYHHWFCGCDCDCSLAQNEDTEHPCCAQRRVHAVQFRDLEILRG